jgi:hypothetical protein
VWRAEGSNTSNDEEEEGTSGHQHSDSDFFFFDFPGKNTTNSILSTFMKFISEKNEKSPYTIVSQPEVESSLEKLLSGFHPFIKKKKSFAK